MMKYRNAVAYITAVKPTVTSSYWYDLTAGEFKISNRLNEWVTSFLDISLKSAHGATICKIRRIMGL